MKLDTWQSRAVCVGETAVFYEDEKPENVAHAKATCYECPVRGACLAAGMDEEFGVWGGLTTRERRKLKRKTQVA